MPKKVLWANKFKKNFFLNSHFSLQCDKENECVCRKGSSTSNTICGWKKNYDVPKVPQRGKVK